MQFRERTDEERTPQGAPAAGPGGLDLSRLRQQGDDFLAAGDEAIRRTLSGDSEQFLKASHQLGGE